MGESCYKGELKHGIKLDGDGRQVLGAKMFSAECLFFFLLKWEGRPSGESWRLEEREKGMKSSFQRVEERNGE